MSHSKTEYSSDHPMYDWSNPKRVGPGAWYMFMLMAYNAQNKTERMWVAAQIRLFCDFFKCGDCNGHCHAYIAEHSPDDALEGKYDLFYWVVDFMNAVNDRLKKPLYCEKILFQTFEQKGFKFCDSGCGQNEHPTTAAAHSKEASFYPYYQNVTAVRTRPQSHSPNEKTYSRQRIVYPHRQNTFEGTYSPSSSQFFPR